MNCVRKNVECLWGNITKHIRALPSWECERALHGKERAMSKKTKIIIAVSLIYLVVVVVALQVLEVKHILGLDKPRPQASEITRIHTNSM